MRTLADYKRYAVNLQEVIEASKEGRSKRMWENALRFAEHKIRQIEARILN